MFLHILLDKPHNQRLGKIYIYITSQFFIFTMLIHSCTTNYIQKTLLTFWFNCFRRYVTPFSVVNKHTAYLMEVQVMVFVCGVICIYNFSEEVFYYNDTILRYYELWVTSISFIICRIIIYYTTFSTAHCYISTYQLISINYFFKIYPKLHNIRNEHFQLGVFDWFSL